MQRHSMRKNSASRRRSSNYREAIWENRIRKCLKKDLINTSGKSTDALPCCRSKYFLHALYQTHFHFVGALRHFQRIHTIRKFVQAFPVEKLLSEGQFFLKNTADFSAVIF